MVYLYPLTKDSVTFRRGVLLDQIMPRGMYTHIMVTVSIPEDGKFIFAGVYRGSTDIRAYEVDTIVLPTNLPHEIHQTKTLFTDEKDIVQTYGLPTAKVVSHTHSDAKLKGFAAAKSLYHQVQDKTEYRLLCGIGIKTVHLWRFYHKKTPTGRVEWTWECIFDKQTNGISLEFITFHPSIPNQFISKSEHQNVRIWHLEEDYHASDDSVTIRKKAHTDVKQTVDTVAVYGEYAYGGTESLAVIDLQAATRMDLDLPLSAKEQRAQFMAAIHSRNAHSLRAWHPRGSRRRGAEETSGPRHMRTVSKVAGQDASPFTVGMCSDGSVFFHQPREETGIATPLDYIEGYEKFFVDPSLDFQAQFSDLTRVNTSGFLAVLPLPETEAEKWMIVAANQDQLLVRSLNAFLHQSQVKKASLQVKSDLMHDLQSSSDEKSGLDSDADDESEVKAKQQRPQKLDKKTLLKRSRQSSVSKYQEARRSIKRSRQDSETASCQGKNKSVESGDKKRKVSVASKKGPQKKSIIRPKPLNVVEELKNSDSMAVLTTPKRRMNNGSAKLPSTASPVVSISSLSGSSNPNTPEQPELRGERHVLTSPLPVVDPSNHYQVKSKTKNDNKPMHRMKALALFIDNEKTEEDSAIKAKWDETKTNLNQAKMEAGRNNCTSRETENPTKSSEAVKQDEVEQSAEKEDAALEDELEQLEHYEPQFLFVPDKCSLLAATMYQYIDPAATSDSGMEMAHADDDVEADRAAATTEQVNLLMQFSRQNERLKMNFLTERERIYKQLDCRCAASSASSKKASSTSGMNWRRNVAHTYLKRKQLKRRHKKQLATQLHQLRASYAVQIQELNWMQQMQANAFRARQQFQHLHRQISRHANPRDTTSVSSPVKHSAMPDHLSDARFPYPDLLT